MPKHHHAGMNHDDETGLQVDNYPANRRSLRLAVVTETYPPEVNGVALTLAKLVDGLRAANHDVQLIRLRQSRTDAVRSDSLHSGFQEVLMRGLPIPRYPELRMGLPSKGGLIRLWQLKRPDLVHIATEGPLGWSALRAARYLKLPVSSDYRTNFQSYSTHYGVGFLYKPIMAYLRKFHNRAHCTMVPTQALRTALAAAGFHQLRVVSRGVDTVTFDPAHRSAELRARWGLGFEGLAVVCVGRLAPEKIYRFCCGLLRPSSIAIPMPAWYWWAAARCARNCKPSVRAPCLPGSCAGRPWQSTMPRLICF